MTVVLHDAHTIRLIGACPADDGETLLQQTTGQSNGPRSTGGAARVHTGPWSRFFSSPDGHFRAPQPANSYSALSAPP